MDVLFDDAVLSQYMKDKKIQPYRLKKVLQELYKNQNISWNEMTTLPKDLKSELSEQFEIINLSIEQIIESDDTTKFAFKTHD